MADRSLAGHFSAKRPEAVQGYGWRKVQLSEIVFSIFVLKHSKKPFSRSRKIVSACAVPGVALQNQNVSNPLQKPDSSSVSCDSIVPYWIPIAASFL
jgi:hypothetical protein